MIAWILFKFSFLSRFFPKLVVDKAEAYTIYKVFNGLYVQSERMKYFFLFNKKYKNRTDVNHSIVYLFNGKNVFVKKIHMPFISKYNNDLPDFNVFSVQLKMSQFILDFVYNNPFENSDLIYHSNIFKEINQYYKDRALSFKIVRTYSDVNGMFPYLKILITVPDMYVSNCAHYIFKGYIYKELDDDKINKLNKKMELYSNSHSPDVFYNSHNYFVAYFDSNHFNFITFFNDCYEYKKVSLDNFSESSIVFHETTKMDVFLDDLIHKSIAANPNGYLYEKLESIGYEVTDSKLTVDDLVVLDMVEY